MKNFINSEDWEDRKRMAIQGFGLDVLVHDENENVRKAVITQAYNLRAFESNMDYGVNEQIDSIRNYFAMYGFGFAKLLKILSRDSSRKVRLTVACIQPCINEEIKNNKHMIWAMKEHMVVLKWLLTDVDKDVRDSAYENLKILQDCIKINF